MGSDDRDRAGRTPLHYAVITSPVGLNYTAALDDPALNAENHRKVVEFIVANTTQLLNEGADVNARDDEGCTPLHFAAKGQSDEAVRLLLDAGADVNAVNNKGETPLYNAVWNTTPAAAPIARLLLERGADPTIETHQGWNALKSVDRLQIPELLEVFAHFR